jgi:hypothetical protein
MKYSFTLNWSELPTELQDQKIDEYILASRDEYRERYAQGESEDDLTTEQLETLGAQISDEELLDNENFRDEAIYQIEARFPMYF